MENYSITSNGSNVRFISQAEHEALPLFSPIPVYRLSPPGCFAPKQAKTAS